MASDFEPIRRALNGHLTDREYGAQCEREAQRYRQALEEIEALFTNPFVDAKAIRSIVEAALASAPNRGPINVNTSILGVLT